MHERIQVHKVEGTIVRRNPAKDAYLRLLGLHLNTELPSIAEMPRQIELPAVISTYLRHILMLSLQKGREYEGGVRAGAQNQLKLLSLFPGFSSTLIPLRLMISGWLNLPAVCNIHSHTKSESYPSPADAAMFCSYVRGAYLFGIVAENNATLIAQTSESVRMPFSSTFSAERVEEYARKLRERASGLKEYGQLIARAFWDEHLVTYRYLGNLLENQSDRILFSKIV